MDPAGTDSERSSTAHVPLKCLVTLASAMASRMKVASYQFPVASYQLPVASCQLPVASSQRFQLSISFKFPVNEPRWVQPGARTECEETTAARECSHVWKLPTRNW